MSKALFSVSLDVRRTDCYDIAQLVIDSLQDDFGKDAFCVAGCDELELLEAIIDNKRFQAFVAREIKESGFDALNSPYDYFYAEDLICEIRELQPIINALDSACLMISELEDEEDRAVNCIPVPAGYKLVRV